MIPPNQFDSQAVQDPAFDKPGAQNRIPPARYQHPKPFPSKSGKWWMGSFYEYVPHRCQRQVKLCPRWENGRVVPKRLAQRILDSIVEPINRSAGACVEA